AFSNIVGRSKEDKLSFVITSILLRAPSRDVLTVFISSLNSRTAASSERRASSLASSSSTNFGRDGSCVSAASWLKEMSSPPSTNESSSIYVGSTYLPGICCFYRDSSFHGDCGALLNSSQSNKVI